MTATGNRRARRTGAAKAGRKLPSLPGYWRALAGGLSGLALTIGFLIVAPRAGFWVKEHPYFLVQAIEVRGNGRLSDEEILDSAAVRIGQSLWDVSLRRMGMRLEAHPWIQRARVRRYLPARLVIEVTERKPIAIVRFDELHYVDRRGSVLGPLSPEDSRDLPIITGLEEGAGRAFAPLALPRTAQLLRWCERRGCIDEMSEVFIDREDGVTMFPIGAKVAVHLGWGHWSDKLSRSARVFAAWEGRLDQLAFIDVSLEAVVVVRTREPEEPARRPPRGESRV